MAAFRLTQRLRLFEVTRVVLRFNSFPAGMEPMGIERHRRSPKGERAGASEWSQREAVRHRRSKAEVADRELGSSSQSIEVQAHVHSKRVSDTQSLENRSRREYRKAGWPPASNNTANQSGKIISTAFNRAVRLGKIKLNPCHALDQLPEETAERSTFTLEQIRKLICVATTHDWKIAILFGFSTGARLSDIANLRWSAINFEDRLVSFVPRKTKRAKKILVMPLHPNLEAELVKRRGLPLAFVFPSLAGRGTGGAHGLSAGFAAIMEPAESTALNYPTHGRGARKQNAKFSQPSAQF